MITIKLNNVVSYLEWEQSDESDILFHNLFAKEKQVVRWGRNSKAVSYEYVERPMISPEGVIGTAALKKVIKGASFNPASYVLDIAETYDPLTYDEKFLPTLKLRDYQVQAVNSLLPYNYGALELVTGSGKTEIIIALTKALQKNKYKVIIMAHTNVGERTIIERFQKYKCKDVVLFRKNKDLSNYKIITVTTPKILKNTLEEAYYEDDVGHRQDKVKLAIIFDECHHIKSETNQDVIKYLVPDKLYGVSATIYEDYSRIEKYDRFTSIKMDDAMTYNFLGDIRFKRTYAEDAELAAGMNEPLIFNIIRRTDPCMSNDWQEVYKLLYSDGALIFVSNIIGLIQQYGLKTVVFINNKEISEKLLNLLSDTVKGVCWYGGYGFVKSRALANVDITSENIIDLISNNQIDVIIATTHLDEAVNIPALDCAILLEWKVGRVQVQRAGRILRKSQLKYSFIINIDNEDVAVLHRQSVVRIKSLEKEYSRSAVEVRDYTVLNQIIPFIIEQSKNANSKE